MAMKCREEKNFRDWYEDAFGHGYGTGEAHILPALHQALEMIPSAGDGTYDHEALERALTPAVAWLLIDALCRLDIIEYGTSPQFGWLTKKGDALQEFMQHRTPEALYELVCGGDENYVNCYPDACNCGPNGYEKGRLCRNPFWR